MKIDKDQEKRKLRLDFFDKYRDKQIENNYKSQGHKKLWNYYLQVTKSDHFQKEIKKLRIEGHIPLSGFTTKKLEEEWRPPKNYHLKLKKTFKKLCQKYALHYMDWHELMMEYLTFNKINPIFYVNSFNLFLIDDILERKELAKTEGELYGEDCEFEASDDFAFPVAIRISPYASQRDLINFIKTMWPTIQFYQMDHRSKDIKIGFIKSKKNVKRDEFIYQNKNKPRKEIMKLLMEKYGDSPDYGAIGKIISIEQNRRKKL